MYFKFIQSNEYDITETQLGSTQSVVCVIQAPSEREAKQWYLSFIDKGYLTSASRDAKVVEATQEEYDDYLNGKL